MIVYQVINCLISQPKHMLWVLIRTIAMRRFLLALNYRLNELSKKILQFYAQKLCLEYVVYSMQI